MQHAQRISTWRWGVFGLLCLMGLVALAAVCIGTVRIPATVVMQILWQALLDGMVGGGSDAPRTHEIIILALRGPRVCMAILVGMALAVAGATFQSMLRNPLAEPYLLGISSGGACGAVIALMSGWSLVPLAAFAGALLSATVVVMIAHRSGSMHPHTLVLAGVVVNAFLASLIAVLITFSSADTTRGIVFWLMGSVSIQGAETLSLIGIAVLGSIALLFWKARNLDLLAQGESVAKQLGLEVERHMWFLMVVTSLLTGIAVAYNGLIGFIGLIIPHIGAVSVWIRQPLVDPRGCRDRRRRDGRRRYTGPDRHCSIGASGWSRHRLGWRSILSLVAEACTTQFYISRRSHSLLAALSLLSSCARTYPHAPFANDAAALRDDLCECRHGDALIAADHSR